jgi:ribosome-associated translation inhibitor RaiA
LIKQFKTIFMLVQVHTDKNIEGGEKFIHFVTEEIKGSLHRFTDKITRVDVHLSDENAGKSGDNDKRCMIEAKVEGVSPVVVTNFDASVEKAFMGAIDKIQAALDTVFGKLKQH